MADNANVTSSGRGNPGRITTKRIEKSGSGRTCGRWCRETGQLSFAANCEALPRDDDTGHRRSDGRQPLNAQRHASRHAGFVAIHLAAVTRQCRIVRIGAGRGFVRTHVSRGHRHGLIACIEHARIEWGNHEPHDQEQPQQDGRICHTPVLAHSPMQSKAPTRHSDHNCARAVGGLALGSAARVARA
jgi:hypothetical protein